MSNILTFDEFSEGMDLNEKKILGDKIKIEDVLDKECIFGPFLIGKSKYDGEVLQMQVEFGGNIRCVFTSSGNLIKMIKSSMDKNRIDHHDFYDIKFEGRILKSSISNGKKSYQFSK